MIDYTNRDRALTKPPSFDSIRVLVKHYYGGGGLEREEIIPFSEVQDLALNIKDINLCPNLLKHKKASKLIKTADKKHKLMRFKLLPNPTKK